MQQKAFLKQWNKSFKIEAHIGISQDRLFGIGQKRVESGIKHK